MDSILSLLLLKAHAVTTVVSYVILLSSKIIGVKKDLLILFSVVS